MPLSYAKTVPPSGRASGLVLRPMGFERQAPLIGHSAVCSSAYSRCSLDAAGRAQLSESDLGSSVLSGEPSLCSLGRVNY